MKLKYTSPWKKSYEKSRQCIKKWRHHFANKSLNSCIVKAMIFQVVMDGGVSWSIKKAECQRTDAFELWCWRRLLRIPEPPERLLEFAQIHVHLVNDTIQLAHPLLPPSPPALNLFQHQGLFQ